MTNHESCSPSDIILLIINKYLAKVCNSNLTEACNNYRMRSTKGQKTHINNIQYHKRYEMYRIHKAIESSATKSSLSR